MIAQSFVGAGSSWKIRDPTIGLGYSYVNGPPVTAKSFYDDNVVLDSR